MSCSASSHDECSLSSVSCKTENTSSNDKTIIWLPKCSDTENPLGVVDLLLKTQPQTQTWTSQTRTQVCSGLKNCFNPGGCFRNLALSDNSHQPALMLIETICAALVSPPVRSLKIYSTYMKYSSWTFRFRCIYITISYTQMISSVFFLLKGGEYLFVICLN